MSVCRRVRSIEFYFIAEKYTDLQRLNCLLEFGLPQYSIRDDGTCVRQARAMYYFFEDVLKWPDG
ncbi:unnamed protein product, partial [Didymodactylos carnosus]